jgi:hypothetical protein
MSLQHKMFFSLIVIIFLTLILNSCKKKEDVNSIQCDTSGLNPDSILYSNTVSVIIQKNCIRCHSNSVKKGWVNLEGYEHVRKYTNNHKLLGAIAHLEGYIRMPRDADQLSQEDICKIKFWIDNGAMNN